MGGLFGSPRAAKPPKVEPPAPMPDPESEAVREAQRGEAASIFSRDGRRSTILSQPIASSGSAGPNAVKYLLPGQMQEVPGTVIQTGQSGRTPSERIGEGFAAFEGVQSRRPGSTRSAAGETQDVFAKTEAESRSDDIAKTVADDPAVKAAEEAAETAQQARKGIPDPAAVREVWKARMDALERRGVPKSQRFPVTKVEAWEWMQKFKRHEHGLRNELDKIGGPHAEIAKDFVFRFWADYTEKMRRIAKAKGKLEEDLPINEMLEFDTTGFVRRELLKPHAVVPLERAEQIEGLE